MLLLLLVLDATVKLCRADAAPAPILFIVQAQKGSFHAELADTTRDSILKQWAQSVPSHAIHPPQIILTTELQDDVADSAWTYFPLFKTLQEKLVADTSLEWVGVLNENTQIDLKALGEYAKHAKGKLKPAEDRLFLGRALKDAAPSIVHHFKTNTKEKTVLFPDPESGIFLSRKLVLDLATTPEAPREIDFNIDASFELADFLLAELGVQLTDVPELCSKEPKKAGKMCVSFPRNEYQCLKKRNLVGLEAVLDSVLVFVSTCEKYHTTRVPVVKETWADIFPNLHFISDVVDPDIPTEVLPKTINTETGFCNKTRTMLDRFLTTDSDWLLITDDDTILSPVRLAQLLACYSTEEPIILGQRYGYGMAGGRGYNYVTGGGGKLINRLAVEGLVALEDGCACPAADTPEDMYIFGACAKRAGIQITHSNRMFQARPPDYPSAMVSYRKPISFHKHWEIDPVKEVYNEWFRKADDALRNQAGKDEL